MPHRLSVIVVSWNTAELLDTCLASLLESARLLDCEVFVVDNASTDGSAELVARAYPQVRLLRNAENRGFAAANNQALRQATGEYLLLLNADTMVLGDVLSRSTVYLDRHPEVAVMGCRVLNRDRTVQHTCFREPSLLNILLKTTGLFRLGWPRFFCREHMPYWQRDSERDVDVVTGCYMMVRRRALAHVGLLDESFFFCGEETDWCRRFRQAGWCVRFAPVGEIIHYGNASGRRFEHRRDVLLTAGLVRFHRKHGGRCAAAVAWMLLWVFNVTHFLAWWVVGAVRPTPAARARSAHFRRVITGFGEVWPRGDTGCHAGVV